MRQETIPCPCCSPGCAGCPASGSMYSLSYWPGTPDSGCPVTSDICYGLVGTEIPGSAIGISCEKGDGIYRVSGVEYFGCSYYYEIEMWVATCGYSVVFVRCA